MAETKCHLGCVPGAALARATAALSAALSGVTTLADAHSASEASMPSKPSNAGVIGVPHGRPNGPVVGSGYAVTNTWRTVPAEPPLTSPNAESRLLGSAARLVDNPEPSQVKPGAMQVATMPANPMSFPPIEITSASIGAEVSPRPSRPSCVAIVPSCPEIEPVVEPLQAKLKKPTGPNAVSRVAAFAAPA